MMNYACWQVKDKAGSFSTSALYLLLGGLGLNCRSSGQRTILHESGSCPISLRGEGGILPCIHHKGHYSPRMQVQELLAPCVLFSIGTWGWSNLK